MQQEAFVSRALQKTQEQRKTSFIKPGYQVQVLHYLYPDVGGAIAEIFKWL